MENFFYDDVFCSDLYDFISRFDFDSYNDVPDDFKEEVALSKLQPIIKDLDIDSIVEGLFEDNQDRFSEDYDIEEAEIKQALRQSIDFEKFKELCPKLHYVTKETAHILKKDLETYFD